MKFLAYSFSVLLVAGGPSFSSSNKQVFLSMKKFEQLADRAHGHCASVDLDFSKKFYDCIDKKMHGIYIDSSTARSGN